MVGKNPDNMDNEIMFENEYVISKSMFMEWGRENAFCGKRLLFTIFWGIIALGCTVLAIISKMWVAVLMVLYCIYRGYIRWIVLTNSQYNIISKHHGGSDWIRKILFQQETIQVVDLGVCVQYKYEDITEIKEKGNYIKLIAKNDTVIRLYADMFVNCSWNECRSYICEKINKKQ